MLGGWSGSDDQENAFGERHEGDPAYFMLRLLRLVERIDKDDQLGNTHRISVVFTLEDEKFKRKGD